MHFESVTCRAFGPFRNTTLSLKPGMNVIFGPNEAGKSTWSAAIAIGLCGRRRGRGVRAEDAEFARRHRPWDDPTEWAVSAVIHLADGRQVELSHDLAGGVESSARDARYANRDLSNEVMNDGAPDGAFWLGLDRRSFLSIAYVRQSELLSILRDANSLQADLQRAAATARTDATANDAVTRLEAFRQERVGTSRAPKKPLRRSQAAVGAAQEALEKAQREHAQYRSRRRKIDVLEQEVSDGELRVAAAQAVLAENRAAAARDRHTEARKLGECFPNRPPRESPERDRLAQRIVKALDGWQRLADTLSPTGPTVLQITEQIAKSEAEEDALVAVHAERILADQQRRLTQARELATLFPDQRRPVPPAEDEHLARRLAAALGKWEERPMPQPPPNPSMEELEAELRDIDVQTAHLTGRSSTVDALRSVPRFGIAAFIAAAVALMLIGTVLSWVGFFGLIALTGLWSKRLIAKQDAGRRRQEKEVVEKRRRLERTIATRQVDDRLREEDAKRLCQAEQNVRRAGTDLGIAGDDLDATVEALREWHSRRKTSLEEFSRLSDDWEAFQRLHGGTSLSALATETAELEKRVEEQVAAASQSLLSAARQRNISNEDLTAFQRNAGAERGRLRTALGQRQEADRVYHQRMREREAAVKALAAAARGAGIFVREPEGQAVSLEQWLEQRREEMATLEEQGRDWDRLQQILGGKTLDELGQIATRLIEKARSFSASLDRQALIEARERETTELQFDELQSNLEQKKRHLERSLGEIGEFQTTLPDLAQVEEALAATKAERDHVHDLDSILGKTIDFLRTAEDRIHRDLAPILQQGVLHWLSQVTGGRYVDCRVDPETLTLEVRGPDSPWRAATSLSHGTAEQIYLLLRLVLTRHLGKPEESCPLILDDPVGASDAGRRGVLMETLLTCSDEHQVILFAHDADVKAWAERRLTGPHHQTVELTAEGIPP